MPYGSNRLPDDSEQRLGLVGLHHEITGHLACAERDFFFVEGEYRSVENLLRGARVLDSPHNIFKTDGIHAEQNIADVFRARQIIVALRMGRHHVDFAVRPASGKLRSPRDFAR